MTFMEHSSATIEHVDIWILFTLPFEINETSTSRTLRNEPLFSSMAV